MTNNKIFFLTVILMTIVGISSVFASGKKEFSNSVPVSIEQSTSVENSVSNENREMEYTLIVVNNCLESIPCVQVQPNQEDVYFVWESKLGLIERNKMSAPGKTMIFSFKANESPSKITLHRDNGLLDKPFYIEWPNNIRTLTITLSGQYNENVIYTVSFTNN